MTELKRDLQMKSGEKKRVTDNDTAVDLTPALRLTNHARWLSPGLSRSQASKGRRGREVICYETPQFRGGAACGNAQPQAPVTSRINPGSPLCPFGAGKRSPSAIHASGGESTPRSTGHREMGLVGWPGDVDDGDDATTGSIVTRLGKVASGGAAYTTKWGFCDQNLSLSTNIMRDESFEFSSNESMSFTQDKFVLHW